MHLWQIVGCIVFSDLGIECCLESSHKLLNGRLHLNGNTSRCIHNRAKEDIEHHVQTLSIKNGSKISPKAPACKSKHLLEQCLIEPKLEI